MAKENKYSQEELTMQFQMFEQQINILQEQQQAVERAIIDLRSLNLELDDLIGKKGEDIISPLGRGIYVNAKLNSEELLVDIGNKNFVKKSIPETKIIIQNQTKKLEKAREEINKELEKINEELTRVFMSHQQNHKDHTRECECGEEGCNCEEDCE